jgi:hypothetical protein
MVKCCLKVNGSYKWAAPDVLQSTAASYCSTNRFVQDIESYPTLQHVLIFGDPGWHAVNELRIGDDTIKERFERSGIAVLNLPHFANNFQQRQLYVLSQEAEHDLLKEKPHYRPYARVAGRLRKAMLEEISKLKSGGNSRSRSI